MPAAVPLHKKKRIQIAFRITGDMRNKLKILSKKQYIPMSEYIRALLQAHIDKKRFK